MNIALSSPRVERDPELPVVEREPELCLDVDLRVDSDQDAYLPADPVVASIRFSSPL